jgi:hypothetical protein
MGLAGKEKVRQNFLITTNMLNYLKLFYELSSKTDTDLGMTTAYPVF